MKTFPFAALVGQDSLKTALMVCAVNPSVGGVLIRGDKGTAKSTAARGLSEIMPAILCSVACPFNCAPESPLAICEICSGARVERVPVAPPFVNLPLGATEDRVIGSIDFERALKEGKKAFQPGLLASAHRGILYIDEVNLLPDHLVDVLLDVAAMGINSVQREGLSISHPAKFALIGTMNLEEGDLRPQLLDRFGMMVEVEAPEDSEIRAEVVRRRISFEEDTQNFHTRWREEQECLRQQVATASTLLASVVLADELINLVSQLCSQLGARSLRADLVVCKVARTLAALAGRAEVSLGDIQMACQLALPHRTKRKGTDSYDFNQDKLEELINEATKDDSHKSRSLDEKASPDHEGAGHDSAEINDREIHAGRNPGQAIRIELDCDTAEPRDGRRSTASGQRPGRFVRAVPNQAPNKLAINATMQHALVRNNGVLDVLPVDLHQKVEINKNANLVLFVVDASGSMAALKRMELVKGLALSLLEDAYRRRDEVAVIAFAGSKAKLLLAPTRSVEVAHKQLVDLPTGGRTPLAHALQLSGELLDNANIDSALLILLTDGKGNVPLSAGSDPWQDTLAATAALSRQFVVSLVVDTESGYLRFKKAETLAKLLKAEYLSLENLTAESLSLKIRSKLKTGKRRLIKY